MNLNIASGVKTVKNVLTSRSPVLLVGTAIAGVVATGILGAKGGYKARGIVDEFEDNECRESTIQEKIQLTWLCYAAPVLTASSSIAATVGVHAIHNKRQAGMAAMYAVTAGKLDDVQTEIESVLGAKKTQQLNDKVAQRTLDRDKEDFENKEIIITGEGTELFHDDSSGRYFEGSLRRVESAMNSVVLELTEGSHQNLNDFYDHVGLEPTPLGLEFGWSAGEKPMLKVGEGKISPDGRPAVNYWFHPAPTSGYVKNR